MIRLEGKGGRVIRPFFFFQRAGFSTLRHFTALPRYSWLRSTVRISRRDACQAG